MKKRHLSVKQRRLIQLPALLGAMTVLMGTDVGLKPKTIEPNRTTRVQLDATYLPDAHTLDGRFALYAYHKFSLLLFPGFEKQRRTRHRLALVEFDEAGLAVKVATHKCKNKYKGTLCAKPPQEALLQLINEAYSSEVAASYNLDNIRYCDMRSRTGFQMSGDLKKQSCPPDQNVPHSYGLIGRK